MQSLIAKLLDPRAGGILTGACWRADKQPMNLPQASRSFLRKWKQGDSYITNGGHGSITCATRYGFKVTTKTMLLVGEPGSTVERVVIVTHAGIADPERHKAFMAEPKKRGRARKALEVCVPVQCQNGHTATARFTFSGLNAIYQGVRAEENCACPKTELGQGWTAIGAPYVEESVTNVEAEALEKLCRMMCTEEGSGFRFDAIPYKGLVLVERDLDEHTRHHGSGMTFIEAIQDS